MNTWRKLCYMAHRQLWSKQLPCNCKYKNTALSTLFHIMNSEQLCLNNQIKSYLPVFLFPFWVFFLLGQLERPLHVQPAHLHWDPFCDNFPICVPIHQSRSENNKDILELQQSVSELNFITNNSAMYTLLSRSFRQVMFFTGTTLSLHIIHLYQHSFFHSQHTECLNICY